MNVPKLRFKEFNESWKQITLGGFIFERSEISNNDLLPICSLTIEKGVTSKTDRYEREHLVSDTDSAYKLVKKGDFAYNPMNLRFGAIAKYSGENPVRVSKYYNVFYCDTSVDSSFFEIYFKTTKMLGFYDKMSTGSLVEKKRVHFSDFLKFKIPFPSLSEQIKIASFLTAIDEKITQLTQKYDLLKQYKKGVMQQIFSQKLRFKDEDGREFPEWDNISLIELAGKNKKLFDDGDWIESEFITNSGVRLIQTGNIGIGNFIDKELKKYISDDSFSKLKCKEIFPGDILICRLAEPAGRACICSNTNDVKVITSVDVTIFRPLEKIANRRYLINFFCTPEWFDNVTKMCGGSTRTRIARGALGKIQVRIPSLCEQTKIANFLTAIDDKIIHTKTQLDAVKLYKKGLLQQMFV